MTANDFETAARAEANKLTEHWGGERNRRRFLSIFTSGAEWARDHLDAQELEVTIRREDGKPATCEVRRNEGLVFAGRDHSAELRVAEKEPTDAERAVRELHTARDEQVLTGDCSIEECDHEDECPTEPYAVCAECWRVAEESDPYFGEHGVSYVAHPCPTIKTLDSARAARRDEEKR